VISNLDSWLVHEAILIGFDVDMVFSVVDKSNKRFNEHLYVKEHKVILRCQIEINNPLLEN